MNTTIVPVIDLPFLAREINDAHRQVQFHGKSMLMEAKRAGEALLHAKRDCAHGAFEAWLKAETKLSLTTAREYMRVAKLSKSTDLRCFEGGIRAFLDAYATPRQPEPQAPREFTREDAERALKLHALAERGATEHEQAAASGKLASFAKEFGLTPEAVVGKAKDLLPYHEMASEERAAHERFHKAKAAWDARRAEQEAHTKAQEVRAAERERRISELQNNIERLLKRREEGIQRHQHRPREELLSLLVAAEMRLEELEG